MANAANSSALTTNLNLDPYYDDFDESKGFYRIPFRPGYAVQARELTQIQTILQKQIERFGKHIFRDGSIVLPGQFSIEKGIAYVKVNDNDNLGDEVIIDDWVGRTVTGQTTGLTALIVSVEDGVETQTNTKTIYVRYLNSGSDNVTKVFGNNEILQTSDGATLVSLATSATGTGSQFTITEGVVFAKGFFVHFPTQSIILSRYDETPECKVGFIISEDIIRYTSDQSLLDPALGSSNYSAPGADRLKLTPSLEKYSIDTVEDADFIKLFTIKDGIIQEVYERSQYAIIRDELAKRTYDESGDYYVNGLGVRIRENYDDGTNYGFSNTGNTQLLSIGVEPGLAYIKGYEVGKLVTTWLTTEKGITYENVNSQIVTAAMGNYLIVDEFVGAWNLDEGTAVSLYDTAQNRISTKGWSTASQTGQNIGSAKIKGLEYYAGTPGTANAQYKLYVFDIKMTGSNSFSNVKSVYYNNSTTADMGADVVLSSNTAYLEETGASSLLWSVGSPFVRTLRDSSGNPDMTFTFRRSEDVSIASNGVFVVTIAVGSEQTPYGVGSLADADKSDLILTINENKSITLTGTVTVTNNSTVVTGAGTTFTNLNAGDKIEIGSTTGTHTISSITNATSLIVESAILGTGIAGNTVSKVYKAGDIVDLTTKGATGVERTVTSTSTSLSIDLKETIGSSTSGTLNYKVSRTSAREAAKIMKNSRYVIIDASSAGLTGPYYLGHADIYQVRSIRKKTGSTFTTSSEGTDVTDYFTWDSGQKDAFYDFGSITPKSSITIGGTDYLLVEFDYFAPDFTQGVGYFSVDSYPINDTVTSNTTIRTEDIPIFRSPTNGLSYDLRNYIDFRPVKQSTAADATTVGAASTNPAVSDGFTFEANGLRIPAPSEQIIFDYSYYLPRTDVVTVDRDGNFSIIKGNPSIVPITPTTPDNTMSLAKVFIAPYPSLAQNYAQVIGRSDLSSFVTKTSFQRLTQRDMNVLKQRIVNLEYYASLNALERNAVEYQILDENGLERFKNGIFVDNFRDHSLGATYLPDYNIVVDKDEKTIRPIYHMESIYYDKLANTNIVINSGLATLPYTETAFLTQNQVTTFRNIEVSSYRFIGNLFMSPETDVWVDTQYLPDNAITIGDEFEGGSMGTEWNAWQTSIVGYRLVRTDNGKVLATFNANQRDLAYNNAYWIARNKELHLNTIGYTGSKISTTVETIKQKTRTGTENYNTIYEDTENLGDRVVDVNIVPYIRPQTINLNGRGLKANTRLYVYFDGENMSDYVTPYTPSAATKNLVYSLINSGTGALSPFDPGLVNLNVNSSNEGNALITNSEGECFALLRIPEEKKFRVGSREVKLTDSPTNAEDATTVAIDYFVSQGLIQQKQGTILTTRQVIPVEREVSQSNITTKKFVQQIRPSCMAYSFLAQAPENEEGLFVTSFDVYIAAKHASLGVWFEIREMDSSGGITRNQVPFSEVWLRSSEVTTSADATTPMRVTFPAPVFLYNNTQYALVIHTEGINPDYYFWVSRLGETDILTGNKVTSRPLTGTTYTTNNNLNWDIVPDVDLMVTFYRAAFTTGVTGTLVIGNKPVEKLFVSNVTSVLNRFGESYIGNDKLTLSGITGGTIVVGDVIKGNTSNANTTVTAIDGAVYTVANTGFVDNEPVRIFFAANNVYRGISANVSAISSASGSLSKYVTKNGNVRIHLTGSNGAFFTGSTIRGQLSGESATINAIENFRYSVVDFEPSYLSFNKTTVQFHMQATANTGTKGEYFTMNENENYYFQNEQVVMGRTNEVASLSGQRSNNVKVSMATTTEFLSPVFDIGRTHSVYVDNIINANVVGETGKTGGAAINKYISKPVTLANGQDAEDLAVILTAYRPPTSDIKVYVKLLHAEDAEALADKNWLEMEYLDSTVYSSQSVRDDFIEYNFKIPAANMTGPLEEVQYTNASGTTFSGFKHFQIKVVLTGTNSAVVPRVGDLQVIALQK